MGTILIARWLGDAETIAVVDDASVSEVREAVRGCASFLENTVREQLVAATSELARNLLAHARGGTMGYRETVRFGVRGVEVIAIDAGGGIVDPTTAIAGAPRATGSLGVGLSAARRQVHEMDVDTRRGEGTCIQLRTFASAVPRSEVGVIAVPHPHETVIGDHAVFVRDDRSLTVAVVDGLGHGQAARDAADRAVAEVLQDPTAPLDRILGTAHARLPGTRGAVMAIDRINYDPSGSRELEHAGLGNISSKIISIDDSRRLLPSTPGTLGASLPRQIHVEQAKLRPSDVIVVFSDGIQSRLDLSDEPTMIRHHPIVIAQRILERFGRSTDDAIVVVAR